MVADDVVVTNAHVVAGQDDDTVQVAGEGPRHDAQPVWFDPRNDLAILRAPGVSDVHAPPPDEDPQPAHRRARWTPA